MPNIGAWDPVNLSVQVWDVAEVSRRSAEVRQRFSRNRRPLRLRSFFLTDTIFNYKSNYDSHSPVNPTDEEQIPKN